MEVPDITNVVDFFMLDLGPIEEVYMASLDDAWIVGKMSAIRTSLIKRAGNLH